MNIHSDRTPVVITNTEFKFGKRHPYVSVRGYSLVLTESSLMDASDETEVGRGVRCYDCYYVSIVANTFKQLHGKRGGAVYL